MLNTNFLNKCSSVLHLGACTGEEIYEYTAYSIRDIVFVEANPDLIPFIKDRCIHAGIDLKIYNKAIYNRDNEIVNFNIILSDDLSNHGCSSLLELNKHLEYYPHIKKIKEIQCETITIDAILKENNIKFDLLNMDLQGAEMIALEGCTNLDFKYIYTEVSFEELYKNCVMFEEIKTYLENKGYSLIEVFKPHHSWGDALFKKESK